MMKKLGDWTSADLRENTIDSPTGCWVWCAGLTKPGRPNGKHIYGIAHWRGKTRRAHRVSWEVHRGPIPPGLCVLHKCDNPPCINPDHLFLGTQSDNARDMLAKGRGAPPPPNPLLKGEDHPNSIFTEEQIRAMRALRGVVRQRELAEKFGTSQSVISNIQRRKRWAHIQ